MEIKITQFPNGFRLQPSLDNCMTTPFSVKFLLLVRLLFEERTQYLYQQKLNLNNGTLSTSSITRVLGNCKTSVRAPGTLR